VASTTTIYASHTVEDIGGEKSEISRETGARNSNITHVTRRAWEREGERNEKKEGASFYLDS